MNNKADTSHVAGQLSCVSEGFLQGTKDCKLAFSSIDMSGNHILIRSEEKNTVVAFTRNLHAS